MPGKHFTHARFYDDANGRMLALDPVRRDLNGDRYCDDDPVNYADPTANSGISLREPVSAVFSGE